MELVPLNSEYRRGYLILVLFLTELGQYTIDVSTEFNYNGEASIG